MATPPPAQGAPQQGTRNNDPQQADVYFPIAGVDVSQALEMQTPDTTPLGINVRACEPSTLRMRGGSRPGISQYIPAQVDGDSVIQHLQIIVDPQALALGISFADVALPPLYIVDPSNLDRAILADGTTGWISDGEEGAAGGSGFHTNKKYKRKFAPLTITADNEDKTQGDTFTWTGSEFTNSTLQSGDSISSVNFSSPGAMASAPNGTYPITPSGAVISQAGGNKPYAITYVKGTLAVGAFQVSWVASASPDGGTFVNFGGGPQDFESPFAEEGDLDSSFSGGSFPFSIHVILAVTDNGDGTVTGTFTYSGDSNIVFEFTNPVVQTVEKSCNGTWVVGFSGNALSTLGGLIPLNAGVYTEAP